jgi:hypothetical protein
VKPPPDCRDAASVVQRKEFESILKKTVVDEFLFVH